MCQAVGYCREALRELHRSGSVGGERDDRELRGAQPADGVGDAAGPLEGGREQLDGGGHDGFRGARLALASARVRGEDDAGESGVQARGLRAELLGAALQTAHVVQPGSLIDKPFPARQVGVELGPRERLELDEQLLRVERWA